MFKFIRIRNNNLNPNIHGIDAGPGIDVTARELFALYCHMRTRLETLLNCL